MQYRFFFSQFWSEDKNTVTLSLHSVFKNGINESTVKSIQDKLAFILGDSMVKDNCGNSILVKNVRNFFSNLI